MVFNLIIDALTSWPTILIVLPTLIYLYTTRNYNYWKSRGVNGPKPWPLIGNINQRFSKPQCVYSVENYRKFGRIYGFYDGSKPVLSVAEPELIRDICVKDFNTFVDRGNLSFGDPIFDRSLLTARGEQWKHTRTIVSPTFSSGKLKKMHALIEQCVARLDKALEQLVRSGEELSIRKTMVNYTMDVIALCAFATKIDTHNTGTELHPFVKNSQVFFKPSPRFGIFFFLNATVPSLVKKFELSFVSKDVINYFKSTLRQIISERKSKNLSKNVDFLQLLLDAQNKTDMTDIDEDIRTDVERIKATLNKKDYKMEEMDILATSLIFLLAGHDTTASTLSYLIHELALNPDCQQKLYEEISSQEEPISLDQINQMPYLEACISETLRKYSPLTINQRIPNKDYQLGNTGLLIPKGIGIQIPIYAMHYDPQYFPNPEKFDPERFMPENKSRIIPYTYLPFGAGPRNCIGMRFAMINIKTTVVKILNKYRFIRTANTKTEFQYKKFVVFTQALDMGTVGIELRK